MIKLNLVELIALIFIESGNRILLIDDVYYINELMKLNALLSGIKYEYKETKKDYYKLRFSYQYLFKYYENEIGYVVVLNNNITKNELLVKFDYLYNDEINKLFQDINFNDKYLRVR